MTHHCIKPGCTNQYNSEEPDAYYCPSCDKVRLAIAKQVDAKIATRPRKPTKSALQEYDEAVKVRGFMQVRL
jgi:hypothetical protein